MPIPSRSGGLLPGGGDAPLSSAAARAAEREESRNARRAALNLMEDAVQTRETLEARNAELGATQFLVDSQRRALQMLAEGATRDTVLGFLIGVVESHSSAGMLAAITPLNRAHTHFERGIGASLPDAFNAAVEGVDVNSPTGLCAHASRAREAVAVPDFDADATWQPFGKWVEPYGLRSGWSTPIISSKGQVVGTFANYYRHAGDPTPRNRELVDMVVRTAAIAIERTAAETERDELLAGAQRARTAAEAANRAKDEFLALLSHELRNPLSAVRNAVTAARLDPSHQERALEIAARQTEHLTRLVDDLLDVARITQGKIRLRRGRIALIDAVNGAIESARSLIDGYGHTLSVSCAKDCAIDGDPARLEQIIENLLTNAAKYTPPGGRIDVICGRSGAEVVLRVRDNGVGITEEMLPRVFDLFAQEETRTHRARGGLGIGLTVARRLVELHGGRLEVESKGRGCGTEFIARLPAATEGEGQGQERPARPDVVRSARILIVEDNPDAADSLEMLLELFGHRVRTAPDGRAALEAVLVEAPDIVFIDIGLPGMDGYEVARRFRDQPGMECATLVALTGYGRAEDKEHALAAGFHVHLTKPVDLDRLQALMAELNVSSSPT